MPGSQQGGYGAPPSQPAGPAEIQQLVQGHKFSGLTPMGTELRKKVVDGIVVPAIRSRQMRKPILVITVTDGQPAGEPTTAVFDTVRFAVQEATSSQYGRGAIAFQFAQVGNDEKAREFLGKLDDDPVVGQLVDCTSSMSSLTSTSDANRMLITSRL